MPILHTLMLAMIPTEIAFHMFPVEPVMRLPSPVVGMEGRHQVPATQRMPADQRQRHSFWLARRVQTLTLAVLVAGTSLRALTQAPSSSELLQAYLNRQRCFSL